MSITEKERQSIIRKACELIDARIRYNIALQKELRGYNDEQIKVYFSAIIDTISVQEIRNDFITDVINGDITTLKETKKIIETGLVDKRDQLKLTLLMYNRIKPEEILIQHRKMAQANWDKRIAKGEKLPARSFTNIKGTSEYYTFVELQKICDNLLEPIAQELFSKYLNTIDPGSLPFAVMNVDDFKKLLERCHNKLENIKKNIIKLDVIFEEFKAFLYDITNKYSAYIDISNTWLSGYRTLVQEHKHEQLISNEIQISILQPYHTIYDLKYEIEELTKICDAMLQEQSEYTKKQKLDQDRFAEKLAKKTHEKKLQDTKDALLKKQADEQRAVQQYSEFLAEQERIKTENEAKQKQVSEAITARHKIIEEKRIKNEERKIEARKAVLSEAKIIVSADGRMHSKLQLPEETIESNRNELANILSQETQEISFNKAVKLIEHLGGTVTCNGGSHHKITFNGSVFSYINKENLKFVAGLPRPHNGDTTLRRFELGLLKDAIRSILPENWELHFGANVQDTTTPRLAP